MAGLLWTPACGPSADDEHAQSGNSDSLTVEVPDEGSRGLEAAAPGLIGKWENVGMRTGGMFLSAADIDRPNREFTADGYMIISPLGVEPDTLSFEYVDGYLRAEQEGADRVEKVTEDSLLIVNEFGGEEVVYMFIRSK